MSEKRMVFGPAAPCVWQVPRKKKLRKKAKQQREELALRIAQVILDMLGDGKSVVVLTKYDTTLQQVKYESE